jgi:hypothetical protein
MPTLLGDGEGHTDHRVSASGGFGSSESQTRCMYGCVLYGTWEVQAVDKGMPPAEKGVRPKAVG